MLARVAELGALVAVIEAGEITPAMRASAAAIAQFLGTDARRHHEDEERHVFPPLLAGGDAGWVQDCAAFATGSRLARGGLARTRVPRAGDCDRVRGSCDIDTVREGASILAALYEEHIALEESTVYPEAGKRIGPAALDAMAREMIGRRRTERRRPSGE